MIKLTYDFPIFQLKNLQDRFTTGKEMVSSLQNKYRWLYFIPGHLVSKLYTCLTSKPPLIDEVVKEVTYAFPHEVDNVGAVKLRNRCTVSPNFVFCTA